MHRCASLLVLLAGCASGPRLVETPRFRFSPGAASERRCQPVAVEERDARCAAGNPCACAAAAEDAVRANRADERVLARLDDACRAGVLAACDDGLLLIELCSEGGRGVACEALRRAGRLHAPSPPPPTWRAADPPAALIGCFAVARDAAPPPMWPGVEAPPTPPELERGAVHCFTRDRWSYRGPGDGEWDQVAGSWQRLGTSDRYHFAGVELDAAVMRAIVDGSEVALQRLDDAHAKIARAALARLPDVEQACARARSCPARGDAEPPPPPITLRACLAACRAR